MTDGFLEYDWRFEGENAAFGVDMSLTAPDAAHPVLLTVLFEDFKKDVLSKFARRRTESYKNKILKSLGIIYAGFIEYKSNVKYFFYAPSKSIFESFQKAAQKVHSLGSNCDCLEDPDWRVYFKTLYPNEEKFQTEENRTTIELCKKRGDKLDLPRRVTFHVFFPSDPLRVLFSEEARLGGYAVGDSEFVPEYDEPHGVLLFKISSLVKRDIDTLTTDIIRIAKRYDGKLVGWDAVRK